MRHTRNFKRVCPVMTNFDPPLPVGPYFAEYMDPLKHFWTPLWSRHGSPSFVMLIIVMFNNSRLMIGTSTKKHAGLVVTVGTIISTYMYTKLIMIHTKLYTECQIANA